MALHFCLGLGFAGVLDQAAPPARTTAPAAVVAIEVMAAAPVERPVTFSAMAKAPEIKAPAPMLESSIEAPAWAEATFASQEKSADAAHYCDVGGRLQTALADDAAVMDALGRLPVTARSVANAVSIWNGAWVEGAEAATTIRTRITSALERVPPECREAHLAGPRFIVLDAPDGAVVLVLGSGAWRWAELLDADS